MTLQPVTTQKNQFGLFCISAQLQCDTEITTQDYWPRSDTKAVKNSFSIEANEIYKQGGQIPAGCSFAVAVCVRAERRRAEAAESREGKETSLISFLSHTHFNLMPTCEWIKQWGRCLP